MTWNFSVLITIGVLVTLTTSYPTTINENKLEVKLYVQGLNNEMNQRNNREVIAEWNYSSNITDANFEYKTKVSAENAEWFRSVAERLLTYDTKSFKDADLLRKIKKLTDLEYASLPDEKYKELLNEINAMESNYAKVKVCSYKNPTQCDLSLEPELTEYLATSRDPEELKYYWVEWYNKAGTPVRDKFFKYVKLANEAAVLNNFTSQAEAWLDKYEDSTFQTQLENIFEQFNPIYLELHAYVRQRLHQFYGDIVSLDGPIPMHLLGNMWAKQWDSIADLTTPYPGKKSIDVSDEMVKQGYTARQMFEMGDQFFQSLNLTKLPQQFWDKSILEKPNDGRNLVCHASAWDFYSYNDVRIKQCTVVNMEQLSTVHHELGHIQYFLQYQHQPSVYRDGANPGFHEAVGDVLALSVQTPKHLQKVGLLKNYVEDPESTLNQLYRVSLEKLVFLPFAYTIDKYRWGVFRGDILASDGNCKFWQLREQYSGIEPPVVRSENDFDPPAKYHVSADVEYLRYLVSFIIQFQFHKAVCIKAGQYDPANPHSLLNCDIYESFEAGDTFKAMLSLGSSKPWPDAMEVMTGQRKMDAGPLLEYFQPLYEWLVKTNRGNGVKTGWNKSNKCVCLF